MVFIVFIDGQLKYCICNKTNVSEQGKQKRLFLLESEKYEIVEECKHTTNYCHISFLIAYVVPQQAPIYFHIICFSVLSNCALNTTLFGEIWYEGWNFNSGNYLFTTDTKQIHVSKFYSPSMQSPTLCTTRCQRCGSRRIPLAAPVVLIVRMERSTA